MAQPAFSPRIAVVTGASQGLGLSIALRLADDGLDVAVNDLASKNAQIQEVVSQIEARGRRALAVPADVSREEEVRAMITRVIEQLGGLDVVSGPYSNMICHLGPAEWIASQLVPVDDRECRNCGTQAISRECVRSDCTW